MSDMPEPKKNVELANDLNDEVKAKVREFANKCLDELLAKQSLAMNDVSKILFVTHASIKNAVTKGKTLSQIVDGRLNAPARTSGKKFNVNTLGTMLANLPGEEREAIKQQILSQLG